MTPDTDPHTANLLDEMLVILAEECAEVQQAAMKILRHGADCYNPHDPKRETNRAVLHRELADLFAAAEILARLGLLDKEKVDELTAAKVAAHLAGKTPLYHRAEGGLPLAL